MLAVRLYGEHRLEVAGPFSGIDRRKRTFVQAAGREPTGSSLCGFGTAAFERRPRSAKFTSQLLSFARRQALQPEIFDFGARLGSIADILNSVSPRAIRFHAQLGHCANLTLRLVGIGIN